MLVSIIVAAASNNVIGQNGKLPWHLPEDLKRFRAITMGKPIVMGRLTHESIGKALPGRRNIVLSRQPGYRAAGCEVVETPTAALNTSADENEVMIIGGGRIYQQLLPLTNRIYLTRVDAHPEGDAFFPKLDAREWQVTEREVFASGPSRPLGFTFEILQRVASQYGSPVAA